MIEWLAERTKDQSLSLSDHSKLATHCLICATSDGSSLFTLLLLDLWRIQSLSFEIVGVGGKEEERGRRSSRLLIIIAIGVSVFQQKMRRRLKDSLLFSFQLSQIFPNLKHRTDQIGHPVALHQGKKVSQSVSSDSILLLSTHCLAVIYFLPAVIECYSHLVNQASQRVIREVSHSEPSISLHISTAKLFSTTDPIPRPKCRYRLSTHNPNPVLIHSFVTLLVLFVFNYAGACSSESIICDFQLAREFLVRAVSFETALVPSSSWFWPFSYPWWFILYSCLRGGWS